MTAFWSLGETKCFVHVFLCQLFFPLHFIIQNKGRRPSPRSATGLYAHVIYFKHSSFLAWGSCFRGRHFTPNGQVGSQRANGIICRIVKEKTLQSESLVRIQTSCSQPREGNPSWVESFVRSSQCLFIFMSRGEVQCRLPILWSYPLVPWQWYSRIFFIFSSMVSPFFYLICALSAVK